MCEARGDLAVELLLKFWDIFLISSTQLNCCSILGYFLYLIYAVELLLHFGIFSVEDLAVELLLNFGIFSLSHPRSLDCCSILGYFLYLIYGP